MDATALHRLQFAFTITFHYLFPQLTMGLGLVIAILKFRGTFRGDVLANEAARFWARIFGITFVMGVVTGIPLEFQFGANWARFSEATGGVISQTLAMEGVFAFFLESSFLYLLLFGEKKLGPRLHFAASVAVFAGSWLSGWFIVVTNAFMQHPVGHAVGPDGTIRLASLGAYLTNPWAVVQYAHTMLGSVVTASFVVCSVGAFYVLSGKHVEHARAFLKVGVVTAAVATTLVAFPSGDLQAKLVAKHQPVTFAAMEGHFHTEDGAALTLIGQPDVERMRLDNPIEVPRVLSIMTHQRWDARIEGLSSFPRETWPDNVPLLYYAYHLMVGLGTMMLGLAVGAALLLRGGRLFDPASRLGRAALWALMLALPFPYVANTAGWMTSELGRQPWLVHGLLRTKDGTSDVVSSGNITFSLLGFAGLYALLSLLYFFLFVRIVGQGPGEGAHAADEAA